MFVDLSNNGLQLVGGKACLKNLTTVQANGICFIILNNKKMSVNKQRTGTREGKCFPGVSQGSLWVSYPLQRDHREQPVTQRKPPAFSRLLKPPTFSKLLKHPQCPATGICCPLTEMAFMQSRYVAFCRQFSATVSCCMRSFRLLHLFSSAEDIVHHLMLGLEEAAKHRAVERTRNK